MNPRAVETTHFFTPSGKPIPPLPGCAQAAQPDPADDAEWVDLSDCDLDEEER